MGTGSERRAIHAYVSDDAHDQWHGFAATQGVSVSAILEALAGNLATIDHGVADLDDVVTAARRIDTKRRRRTKV